MAVIEISRTKIGILAGLFVLFIILPLVKDFKWTSGKNKTHKLASLNIEEYEADSADHYFFKPGLVLSDSARVEMVEGRDPGIMITSFFENDKIFYESRIFVADSNLLKDTSGYVISEIYRDTAMQFADEKKVKIELWSYLYQNVGSAVTDVLMNDNYFINLKVKIVNDSAIVSGRTIFSIDEKFRPAYNCLYKVSLDFHKAKVPLIKRIRM